MFAICNIKTAQTEKTMVQKHHAYTPKSAPLYTDLEAERSARAERHTLVLVAAACGAAVVVLCAGARPP